MHALSSQEEIRDSDSKRSEKLPACRDTGAQFFLRPSAFGELVNFFGEFFDLLGVFHDGDGKNGSGVGDAEFLFQLRSEGIQLFNVGADLFLDLFVDGFLVGWRRTRAVHALGEIGVGGVRGRNRLRRGALRRKKARGERKENSKGSDRMKNLATGI